MPQPLILLEFNELCPTLLDRWMAAGDLPNFKRLHDQSYATRTLADEPEAPYLEPWIQWYSLHTGLPYHEHKVFHLTDGPEANHLDIWNLLAQHGKRVWNCSSMNAKRFAKEGSAFMADPWCTSERAFPEELNVFHEFVGRQVREYSNATSQNKAAEAAKFAAFMLTHGLSFATFSAAVKQLAGERFSNGETKWQRVAIADRLLLDVFLHYHKALKPDFSTFFINSTAHLQHSYWRQMDPDSFTVKPSDDEVRRYGSAVLFGYKNMDELLGRLLAYAEGRFRLVFATGLSQQPFLKYESIGGQRFYRPKSIEAVLGRIPVKAMDVQAVMTHQYSMRFASAEEAQQAKARMAGLQVDGQVLFGFGDSSPEHLYFGCQLRTAVNPEAQIVDGQGQAVAKFFDLFYQIEAFKSGRHHPEGYLWIQSERPSKNTSDPRSILDIYPTIADYFGVKPGPVAGQVLAWN